MLNALTAPLEWIVQAIAWLPEALRPGVFLALVVLILWFVLVRHAVPDLWHAVCRGLARLVDLCVGLVLLPEYAITTARRRRGEPPAQWAFALGGIADVLLDGAAWLYERNERAVQPERPQQEEAEEGSPPATAAARKRVPWKTCTAIVLVCAGAWVTMDEASPKDIAKYRLAQAFDPWRDVEAWAHVDDGRGTPPHVVAARRRGTVMHVRLSCAGGDPCRGWILLKSRAGKIVCARYLELPPGAKLVRMRLTRHQAHVSRGGRLVSAGV
jgi:hypothetical protein